MGKGQELLDAAREGDKKTVEKILAQITKRSGPFPSLRRGAGVNVQDDNGYTPLHHACLHGHREIVKLLLLVDASPCVVDKKGATALHLAAWKGDSDVVARLLAHNNPPVNVDQLTSDQETALLIASQFGHVDVVAQLLSRGADVTLKNIKEESALDLAAQYGRLETVQLLLRARPQLVDPYRFPMCRGRSFANTPLHRASTNGHKEVVSTLISAGVDPNVRTYKGTALHEAANYGKASVVRVLLAKGADLNVVDRRGKTVIDVLNEYSEEATKRVRRIIREHMATNGYESEEDLPPFPVQDYSPTGYPHSVGMKAPVTQKKQKNSLSSSLLNMNNNPQNFVRRLANKLGLKTKFSSAPNITNDSMLESDATKSKYDDKKTNSTVQIGNSKFFKMLSKKDDTGEMIANDEFDTISLDRVATLDRTNVVNRSNRSCPGFKTSLPNIAENNENSSLDSDTNSIEITEIENECNNNKNVKVNEAINKIPKLSIFEPRDSDNSLESKKSSKSANIVNECYESYEISKITTNTHNCTKDMIITEKPQPPPRPTITARKLSTDEVVYENISSNIIPPTPAARTHVAPKEDVLKKIVYENIEPSQPAPPKRTFMPSAPVLTSHDFENGCSNQSSLTSSLSSGSLTDEADFEDILLSTKSKSFKHKTKLTISKTNKSRSRSPSVSSDSSDVTQASALDNADVSAELTEKEMYLSMTGTLPNKKTERSVKKKVLFRHKTFTNIEADRNSVNTKDFPKWNDEFIKETLPNYHIRGTGHCIYQAPTIEEFIYIFNKDTLYHDVEPFKKVPNNRDSYFETAICFCKPKSKFHKSAEDLLAVTQVEEKVTISIDELRALTEMNATSFKCFCDDDSCKFHEKNRKTPNNLVVKFSAVKKSISTPDITLEVFPVSTIDKPKLPRNVSFPNKLEEPYAVVDIIRNANKDESDKTTSQYSTMSSGSQLYSIKDIDEAISLRNANDSSLTSDASQSSKYTRQISSSEHSGHWSLHTCDSNVTIRSDMSFKSCLEQSSSSTDGDVSDTDTVKSDTSLVKRPWVHSDSFRFGGDKAVNKLEEVVEETCSEVVGDSPLSVLERGSGDHFHSGSGDHFRSGSGRRRWDENEGTSEGDALSVSSAASSCAAHHLPHSNDFNKVSPTPPAKPPRRHLSVSPSRASPAPAHSYELRMHARSQDDLDDIPSSKHYLKHGRSVDQYVDGKLSYAEYEETQNPRVPPIPNPRPSLKNRSQPVAITVMYENVVMKEQNPRRKLRTSLNDRTDRPRKYTHDKSSIESLLDDSMASDYERYFGRNKIEVPVSPTHYDQPPTPEHPPPTARQAENCIHERIRPLSQEYKRRSALRDSYTETDVNLLRVSSAASVASGATDRSGNTDIVEEYVCDVPFAGLFKGSTTTLDGIGLRPMPAERPKTLRKLKSVYDASPTEPPVVSFPNAPSNGQHHDRSNGDDEDVRKRSNSTSQSGDKSLSILSPFDEQEEWAKISEIMASFGSKLVRESVFVSELEQEFTSRLGLSCSESSLSPSVASNLGLWLAGSGLHDYEPLFVESGFDDVDFVNGVLDESDLKAMGIEETDRAKILELVKQLPNKITEISHNHNNNNISKQNENVELWLKSINLEQYADTFKKHLYVDMDRVKRIWEVELTAVLEIQKSGHRKRILASVSGQHNGPASNMEDISTDLNTLKSNIQQLKEEIKEKLPPSELLRPVPPPVVPSLAPPGGETLKRSKKNRPAPQPPRPSDLEIRAPSELLVGVPGALKTQWKHQPFVLVTGAVTYVANYLGSTVVKELRGTESTKKSIQKLKKSTKEPRDSPDIILSISYRGVKFLNTITKELICEHEIRNIHCACQDADDLTHFAYITKDHASKSHFCHVFSVVTMDQATEVILTLGEAFEVAYQMALREQSNRSKVTQAHLKTPSHEQNKDKPNLNHGRSHSITEIKLNGHQLKIAPIPASLSNEDFQSNRIEGSRSPRTTFLKAPIASTEEL